MKDKTTAPNSSVQKCTCISSFQDEIYGKNMRVHNRSQKKGNAFTTCTTCGSKKSN